MSSIEAIIERQLRRWEMERRQRDVAEKNGLRTTVKPIVTVSRQKGSRGSYIAERLAQDLGYELLHREIVDRICNSSGYARQIIESLDGKMRSRIELWLEGVFKGKYIDSSDYIKQLYKVIMSIAGHGGVVVVGRGANFILKSEQGFNIRVVAEMPRRIQNLIEYEHATREQAEREVHETDRDRAEFMRTNFGRNIDDPTAYDLVINTSHIDIETGIKLLEVAISAKWSRLGYIDPVAKD